jgi:hypothetical protein
VPVVLQPFRDLITRTEPDRQRLLGLLDEEQPTDLLEAVAYWTRVADHGRAELDDAVAAARAAGYSWGQLAIAHDRTAATTQRKFSRTPAETSAPALDQP